MRRILMLALLALALPVSAQAGAPTPSFKLDTHFYSSPAGFLPTGFGQRAANEVNAFAAKQPIPTYVVMVNSDGMKTPAYKHGDRFATEWAKQGLDTERFLIMTVAWSSDCDKSKRKRRRGKGTCLVGFSMPETLGAVYPKGTQKADRQRHFIPKVKRSPQDLKGGLINTLRAANQRIWPKIDPVQIAARKLRKARKGFSGAVGAAQGLLAAKKFHPPTGVALYKTALAQAQTMSGSTDPILLDTAAGELRNDVAPLRAYIRKAESAEKSRLAALATARGDLDSQISTLADLLGDDVEYLPSDTSGYLLTLIKAREVRTADKPKAMAEMATEMEGGTATLASQVQRAKTDARTATVISLFKWTAIFVTLGLILFFFVRRRDLLIGLREQLAEQVTFWDERLGAAQANYTKFQFGDREDVVAFEDVVGRTREVYDRVTTQIDSILMNILGIQTHIRRCEDQGKAGTFFNVQPLRDAIDAIDAEFEFDTDQVNTSDLFSGDTIKITVNPHKFSREQGTTFREAKADWETLKHAAQLRMQEAEKVFPHSTMDRLFELCEKGGVPTGWVDDHPLFGDDDSDAAFYQTVNAIRWTDPLAYSERLDELAEQETAILVRLQNVIATNELVTSNRFKGSLELDSVVAIKDDPKITLDTAMRADDDFQAALETCASDKDLQKVDAKAGLAISLYKKVTEQVLKIKSALKGVILIKAAAVDAKGKAGKTHQAAEFDIGVARKSYTDMVPANRNIEAGDRALDGGNSDLTKGDRLWDAKRHVEARQTFGDAKINFETATKAFRGASLHCAKLDRQKLAFDTKLNEMLSLRKGAQGRVSRYNGSQGMPDFEAPKLGSGLVDYGVLTRNLESQERVWDRRADEAQRAYEAEQARLRRIEEERQRREATARRAEEARLEAIREVAYRAEREEAARRSSYSSSSSSWSSSSTSSSWGSDDSFGGSDDSFGSDDDW